MSPLAIASPRPPRIFGMRRSATRPRLAVGSTAALALPAGAWTVREWCTFRDDQGNSEKCVGEMLRALQCIAVRGAGKRLSARGAYVNGRAREVKTAKDGVIPDTGSNPTDVIDAAIEVGIFPEDERENDPAQTTALLNFVEATASVLVPPGAFVPVSSNDTYGIDQVGCAGSGVGFGMPIYPSYQALRGAQVWKGPSAGEAPLGNHMQVLVARQTMAGLDVYAVLNSWSFDWADGGIGYIPCAYVAAHGFDFCGLLGGPTL